MEFITTDVQAKPTITAQAKVGAETWTVKSDKAPLLKGTKVKVLAIEGVKLIVEPVTE